VPAHNAATSSGAWLSSLPTAQATTPHSLHRRCVPIGRPAGPVPATGADRPLRDAQQPSASLTESTRLKPAARSASCITGALDASEFTEMFAVLLAALHDCFPQQFADILPQVVGQSAPPALTASVRANPA